MSYFAAEGRISREPIEDGIEISAEQYQDALDGMLAGRHVTIDGCFAVIDEPAPEPEPEPEPQPIDLVAYAADKRWRVETGGITVNGAEIRTDEKSQNRVSGAALLALSDPDLTTIDWEAQPGEWVTVDAATMKVIGIAVGRHVQACFTTLRAVQNDIANGILTTVDEIEAADWP